MTDSDLTISLAGDADPLLDHLLEEVQHKIQAGEPVDPDDYARQFPEQADHIRKLIRAMKMLAELKESVEDDKGNKIQTDTGVPQPDVLGDFRLRRELGCGGMGVVYEAEQISLGRRVALKVLPFAALMDPKRLERFQNEARMAASLDHPGIVQVYASGCDRGVHYYAMQYIDGQNMAQLIQDLGELTDAAGRPRTQRAASWHAKALLGGSLDSPPPRRSADAAQEKIADTVSLRTGCGGDTARHPQPAIASDGSIRSRGFFRSVAQLGIQAARALDYAHQVGVIHRDIKPSNLLVDDNGRLWITDFGLATARSESNLTMSGDLLGTLRYMSPEQIHGGGGALDHRTDVYSLGVTLYELLTLQPAFTERNPRQLMRQIGDPHPPWPSRRNRAIPKDLETIVLTAMAPRPASRYATTGELADDLERMLNDEPIRVRRPSRLRRLGTWARRHPAVIWSLGLFVLIVGLAIGITWSVLSQWHTPVAQERTLSENLVNALRHMRRGDTFWENRQDEQAIEENRRGVALLEESPAAPGKHAKQDEYLAKAYLSLGGRLYAVERFDEAKVVLDKLRKAFPDQPAYADRLARAYKRQDSVEFADDDPELKRLSMAIQMNPNNVEYYASRAVVYQENSQWQKALSDYNHCVRLRGSFGDYKGRGFVYLHMRDYDKAVEDCTEAIRIQPYNPLGYHWRGAAFVKNGQLDKAKSDLARAIELSPGNHVAYYYQGLLHKEQGHLNRALADFSQSIRKMPHRFLHYCKRAVVYAELGRNDEALADLKEATELASGNPRRMATLASVLANLPGELCRGQQSLDLAQQAVTKAPEHAGSWAALGMAQYRSGNWQAAADALTKSIELSVQPTARSWLFLSMAHWQFGENDRARRCYQQALKRLEKREYETRELRRVRSEAAELLGIEKQKEDKREAAGGTE